MRLNLENILVPNMIHLHQYTGDVIYSNLLKSTLKVSKLQSTKNKIQNQLRHERVENKAYQRQIKNLQGDLLAIDNEANKGEVTQKIVADKENTIQPLKKKLKIPAT